MGFYSRVLFPRLCDWTLDRPFLARHRRETLAAVEGEILEIGAGTGLNLAHYPKHVRRITTVDPHPGMNKRLARRIEESGLEVDQRMLSGENLPFGDASFDCVVSTFTLCSIPRVEQALAEAYRVLEPGGRFVILEHGLSPDSRVARRQRRWNWLQRRLGDGCRLDVDVRAVLHTQPFRLIEIDNFYLERTPKTHGYLYRGAAIK